MNGLSDRATNHIRKVLIVATLGFFFSSVAATFTFAQEASDPWAGDAFALPKKEQTPVYRKQNPATVFSIRNNLAYDATGTMNLSVEFALGTHASIGAAIGLKTWDRFFFWDSFSYLDNPENNTKWRHLSIVPEFRYYLSEASRGHYFGADLLYIHYNIGALRLPWGLYPTLADQRVQGDLFGGGLFYGYAFPLGNHWRIETQLGVSGGWYSDIAYECATCGLEIGPRSGWTLLPNLGVNIVYTFTKKVKE
jgi:hypothetical protein